MQKWILTLSAAGVLIVPAYFGIPVAHAQKRNAPVEVSTKVNARGTTDASICPVAIEPGRQSLTPPSTLPSQLQGEAFQRQMLSYLQSGVYQQFCRDKGIRDTGSFVNGVYYGTHPAVRVYYSPEVMQWAISGRKGNIPDGAVIIKEQYQPPAARYAGLSGGQLPKATDWTVMIRDSSQSKDGWYWGEFYTGMFDQPSDPTAYPNAGYGIYCSRCHATAQTNHTFTALQNIEGFPGAPHQYSDDGSWRTSPALTTAVHGRLLPRATAAEVPPADPEFLNVFNMIASVAPDQVQMIPPEGNDNLPAPAGPANSFVSSTQCQSCHGALSKASPFGPSMFLPTQPAQPSPAAGANVSSYTEWRWSPMGLAGRDPIFFAQLETETTFARTVGPNVPQAVVNTCLTCHGAMGKRQLDADRGGKADMPLEFMQLANTADPNFKYGALGRDGISCTVCHRIVPSVPTDGTSPLEHFLNTSINGTAPLSPADQLGAPSADLAPYAMRTSTGITPQQSSYLKSSRMCGSCHTINLPVLDAGGSGGSFAVHSIEQSTYLEYLNSAYQNEFATPGSQATTCQGCHMPGSYHNPAKGIAQNSLLEKVAIIQDQTYPATENQVDHSQVTIPTRNDYRRHEFLGLNVFLLQMFRQFGDVLGVRTGDYMSGSTTVVQDTIDNFVQQAQQRTAKVEARVVGLNPLDGARTSVQLEVTVTNLAGHRFPSGVGFRRAFLEVAAVRSASRDVLWASGQTNRLGQIISGNDGTVLASEFFSDVPDGNGGVRQAFQPHYATVFRQDQVQIYEELVQDKQGRFTTSFTRRDETVKDNRLLPLGWTKQGPDPSLNGVFLRATQPDGKEVEADQDFLDGQGRDVIRYAVDISDTELNSGVDIEVTLHYQAIPPSYLRDRFAAVPDGEATKRLYYLTSRLGLQGTQLENWKLKLASTSVRVSR